MPTVSQTLLNRQNRKQRSPKHHDKRPRVPRLSNRVSRSSSPSMGQPSQKSARLNNSRGSMSTETTQVPSVEYLGADVADDNPSQPRLRRNLQTEITRPSSTAAAAASAENQIAPAEEDKEDEQLFHCIFSDGSTQVLTLTQVQALQQHGTPFPEAPMDDPLQQPSLTQAAVDPYRKMVQRIGTDKQQQPLSPDEPHRLPSEYQSKKAPPQQRTALHIPTMKTGAHLGMYHYPDGMGPTTMTQPPFVSMSQAPEYKKREAAVKQGNGDVPSGVPVSSSWVESSQYDYYCDNNTNINSRANDGRFVGRPGSHRQYLTTEVARGRQQYAENQQQHTFPNATEGHALPETMTMSADKQNLIFADLNIVPEKLRWIGSGPSTIGSYTRTTNSAIVPPGATNTLHQQQVGWYYPPMSLITPDGSKFPQPPQNLTDPEAIQQYHCHVDAFLKQQNQNNRNRMLQASRSQDSRVTPYTYQLPPAGSLPFTRASGAGNPNERNVMLQVTPSPPQRETPSETGKGIETSALVEHPKQQAQQRCGGVTNFIYEFTGDLKRRAGFRSLLGCLTKEKS